MLNKSVLNVLFAAMMLCVTPVFAASLNGLQDELKKSVNSPSEYRSLACKLSETKYRIVYVTTLSSYDYPEKTSSLYLCLPFMLDTEERIYSVEKYITKMMSTKRNQVIIILSSQQLQK